MPFPIIGDLGQIDSVLRHLLESFSARLKVWLSKEHTDEGAHGDITATNIVVRRGTDTQALAAGQQQGNVSANGPGPNNFSGDIVAQQGSGVDVAIGKLVTVNGASFLAGYPFHIGLLFGGVTDGYALVKKAKGGAFSGAGTYAVALFDMANAPGNAPMLEMALGTSGNYELIDGGTGSTKIQLGNSNRHLSAIYVDSVISVGGFGFGTWVTPTYNAADYTGSGGMAWGVDAADVVTFKYMIIGKTMFVQGHWDNTSVTAPLGTTLSVTIPGGFTAAVTQRVTNRAVDSGVVTDSFMGVLSGATTINFLRFDAANWTASVNNTGVRINMFFEVQ